VRFFWPTYMIGCLRVEWERYSHIGRFCGVTLPERRPNTVRIECINFENHDIMPCVWRLLAAQVVCQQLKVRDARGTDLFFAIVLLNAAVVAGSR